MLANLVLARTRAQARAKGGHQGRHADRALDDANVAELRDQRRELHGLPPGWRQHEDRKIGPDLLRPDSFDQ